MIVDQEVVGSSPTSRPTNLMKITPCLLVTALLLCWIAVPVSAQTADKKPQPKTEDTKSTDPDPAEVQRRAFAISMITSLADEARSYNDLAVRPRVLARAADTLWNSDRDAALVLFRRAWEAAEKGDAQEVTIKTKDTPPMVIGLRRISGRDLRFEVLSLIARHDKALADELLGKLEEASKRESETTKPDSGSRSNDGWFTSEAETKRLQLARKLLEDGQVERALQFAEPLLNQVSSNSIAFLSALRTKRQQVADDRYAVMLTRAELDPSSDANTVSGLSSYAFTPGMYVTFSTVGGARWTQPEETVAPPDLSPALRNKFLRVAGSILLRPLPPPDQDFTSSGRTGKYMVLKRLLPIFEQYAPDIASGLRPQLTLLSNDPANKVLPEDHPLMNQGVRQETPGERLDKLQDRLDRARNTRERDTILSDMALTLADQGNAQAQDLADKIDDAARRIQVRQHVDLTLVQLTIRKKDAREAARLARTGQLSHTQRSWAYIQVARLLMDSQRQQAFEFLEQAADEARRVEGDGPERSFLLTGVARQFIATDTARAWEIMGEVVKFVNVAQGYNVELARLSFAMFTGAGFRHANIGGEEFGLSGMFPLLAKNDFHRSVDLAKSFKNEAARATATLAIARSVLENK